MEAAPTDSPRRRASTATVLGIVTAVSVLAVTAVMGTVRLLPDAADGGDETRGALVAGAPVEGIIRGGPDRWTFQATAGEEIRIDHRHRAGDLDPFLRLLDPFGTAVAEDDDGGGNLDSRITFAIEQDGEHVVQAGALGNGGGGAYELTLTVLGP